MSIWLRILWLLIAVVLVADAQRNADAEQKCQSFLVSRDTSPLLESLTRNISIDEDGEFECELVLQDRHLPAQIRLTVHEGLFFLAMRHIHNGIDRYTEIMHHARVLREMLPRSRKYAIYVGMWASDPSVGAFKEAMESLQCAFGGSCIEYADGVTVQVEYLSRRLLAQLMLSHDPAHPNDAVKHIAAAAKSESSIASPDYGSLFAIRELSIPQGLDGIIDEATATAAESHYSRVAALATNSYVGFTIPAADWSPRGYASIPENASNNDALTTEVFEAHVQRREPLVIRSMGKAHTVDAILRSVSDEVVDVHRVPYNVQGPFGYSSVGVKEKMPFSAFVSSLSSNTTTSSCIMQSGTCLSGSTASSEPRATEYIMQPVHAMLQDSSIAGNVGEFIGMPYFLDQNTSSISLWVGGGADALVRSKLHMNTHDSIHVVSMGQERVCLFSPDSALLMHTMYPTFAVAPNGLSLQYVSPGGSHHPTDVLHRHYSLKSASDLAVEVSSGCVSLQQGDGLYVPAGWFQELQLETAIITDTNMSIETLGRQLYMVMNYQWISHNSSEMGSFEHFSLNVLQSELSRPSGEAGLI